MIDQHRRSLLSQTTVQCSPEYSEDLVLVGGPRVSTQLPRGILVPDAGISGSSSWNSSPFLSMTQQHVNGLYPPIVGQVDAILNMYNPLLGHSPNYHPTVSPDETSVANARQRPFMAPCSLPDVLPGPQTRVKVPDDHFAMQVDSMIDRALSNLFPRSDTDTPQSYGQMTNQSRAITDVVAHSSNHERSMLETQIPMMPFGAKPFSDDCSSSPTSFKCSTSSAKRLRTMPQEENQASRTHNEGEHLSSAPAPLSQLCTQEDRGMTVEKTAKKRYQCSSCCLSFAQRQGLTRHSKDKHKPKNRCDFCVEFTWPQGRRYVYRRHVQEEHADV